MFKAVGLYNDNPSVEAYTKAAYKKLEDEIHNSRQTRFTTSFWASQFPVADKPCGRLAVYNLLNLPASEPFSDKGRAITLMGQAAEDQIVYRWGRAGITVGGSVALREGNRTNQLSLDDPSTWLSGSLDAVLNLLPEYNRILPVDVKSKSAEVIKEMREGKRSYDPKHYAQVQSYVYLCNLYYEDMGWGQLGLLPADAAVIYYVSRENPRDTYEFFVRADWEGIENALSLLREWKDNYLNHMIPERDPGWRWTEDPCKWCNIKKFVCKPDTKEKNNSLFEAQGIQWAKTVREYSYDDMREKVLSRWNLN